MAGGRGRRGRSLPAARRSGPPADSRPPPPGQHVAQPLDLLVALVVDRSDGHGEPVSPTGRRKAAGGEGMRLLGPRSASWRWIPGFSVPGSSCIGTRTASARVEGGGLAFVVLPPVRRGRARGDGGRPDPENDAVGMAAAPQQLGFEVTMEFDADLVR